MLLPDSITFVAESVFLKIENKTEYINFILNLIKMEDCHVYSHKMRQMIIFRREELEERRNYT